MSSPSSRSLSPEATWVLGGTLLGLALGVIHVAFGWSQSFIVLCWAVLGMGLAWVIFSVRQGRFDVRAALSALLKQNQ